LVRKRTYALAEPFLETKVFKGGELLSEIETNGKCEGLAGY